MNAPGLLIVAVDGVLADSLPSRLECFMVGAEAAGLLTRDEADPRPATSGLDDPQLGVPEVQTAAARAFSPGWLAGRSWQNAARRLAAEISPDALRDEVAIDLAALAAEREWTSRLSVRLPSIDLAALAHCQAAVAAGWRVILRADSTRRSASSLFTYLENETQAVRTVSGDDPGILEDLSSRSLFMSQYAGIIAVSKRHSHVSVPVMRSIETSALTSEIATSMGRFLVQDWP